MLTDETLALLKEGYDFISNRCERAGADLFETRLALEPTICLRGPEAAELFYDRTRFTRVGASPKRVERTLFGEGGVQGLDGGAHRHRKKMFLSLMSDESLTRLEVLVAERWRAALDKWAKRRRVVLFEELEGILTEATCEWAGVPLSDDEVALRARDLASLIQGAGGVLVGYLRARRARRRSEAWLATLIEEVRSGRRAADPESALSAVALHRDEEGDLLDSRVAAVELLNVLRPCVAVARYLTFCAHALHENPRCRSRLERDDGEYRRCFVEEVRRYYPFFPFVAARVRESFTWTGQRFEEGQRAVLDLYGTNHHPRVWRAPYHFSPERFWEREPSRFDLIPQGGGYHTTNHRCPGEWITVGLMNLGVTLLTTEMSYEVPRQDLRIPRDEMPTNVASGFVIEDVCRPSRVRHAPPAPQGLGPLASLPSV